MKRRDTFDRVHKSINSKQKLKLKNHIHFTSLAHSPLQLSESWEAPRLVVDVVTETRRRCRRAAATNKCATLRQHGRLPTWSNHVFGWSASFGLLSWPTWRSWNFPWKRTIRSSWWLNSKYISNFGFYAVIHQDNTKRQGNIFLVNVNFFSYVSCT